MSEAFSPRRTGRRTAHPVLPVNAQVVATTQAVVAVTDPLRGQTLPIGGAR